MMVPISLLAASFSAVRVGAQTSFWLAGLEDVKFTNSVFNTQSTIAIRVTPYQDAATFGVSIHHDARVKIPR